MNLYCFESDEEWSEIKTVKLKLVKHEKIITPKSLGLKLCICMQPNKKKEKLKLKKLKKKKSIKCRKISNCYMHTKNE